MSTVELIRCGFFFCIGFYSWIFITQLVIKYVDYVKEKKLIKLYRSQSDIDGSKQFFSDFDITNNK